MSKVKEILRLKFDVGLSLRDIAALCNCGKSTVDDVLNGLRIQIFLGKSRVHIFLNPKQ